jgi:hypothetical protein
VTDFGNQTNGAGPDIKDPGELSAVFHQDWTHKPFFSSGENPELFLIFDSGIRRVFFPAMLCKGYATISCPLSRARSDENGYFGKEFKKPFCPNRAFK